MGTLRRYFLFAFALIAGLGTWNFAPTPAAAQVWPQRTVKFLLPLGPGAGVDIGARLFADRLSGRWGQPVVVENRPGGDALVALGTFATTRDDHLLLVAPTSAFTAHPFQHDTLPYKPSDLVPVARISNTVVILAVPTSLKGVKSLADFVALVRAQPGKLNWAGTTGAFDFLIEGWLRRAGLQMTKVPYRNGVEAANDLAEGRVQFYQSALAIVQPQIQAGKIRVIAVTNSVRAPAAPEIPTVMEQGFNELALDGLVGIFGQPGISSALRERIAADVRTVAVDPIIADRLNVTGQFLNVGGPAEFGAAVDAQRAQLAAVAKELGLGTAR
jgi:tripartite-type tricarboxylate transporter receptor subunit TctC